MKYFYTNVCRQFNTLFLRGYANDKPFIDEIKDYNPYLFISDPDGTHRTLDDKPVSKKLFASMDMAYKFVKQYEGTNVDIYGLSDWPYLYLNDEFPGKIDYDFTLLSIVSIDIEVSSKEGMPDVSRADQEVTAITLTKGPKIVTFGSKAYTGKNKDSYVLCQDERHLLQTFLKYWNTPEWCPDIVTGWNIEKFDIIYLVRRIANVLGEKLVKALSPFSIVREKEVTRGKSVANDQSGKRDLVYELAGITQLDYFQLYKKFASSARESYALNAIANYELKEQKLDYSEYGTLDNLYEKNFDLYIDYNQHDALLVQRLENKLGYIKLVVSIAYRAKINFGDALTTTRPWDIIIHNYLMEKKIVIPAREEHIGGEILGAYCKDVPAGKFSWVISFDYEAEYPTAISQLNISPETYVRKIKVPSIQKIVETESFGEAGEIARKENCTIAANGCLYRKDKRGFIPELVDMFKEDRKQIKKQMIDLQKKYPKDKQTEEIQNEITKLDNFQGALKILNNGLYGALTNKYFRWFMIDLGESVTTSSQIATRYMEKVVNKYLNELLKTQDIDYVIAADTDSVYINFERLVKSGCAAGESTSGIVRYLDEICKEKIEPHLKRHNLLLSEWFNSYKSIFYMKREVIAETGIWRAKKMYILYVWDKEGVLYSEPQMMYKGIEVVRATTPMPVRNKLKEALKIIMSKDETDLIEYIRLYKEEFMKMPPEEMGTPTSVNGVVKYANPVTIYDLHTPIHVKAALFYNKMIDEKGLAKHVPKIRDHDKIRWVYLRAPNPLHNNAIAFLDNLPKDWGLHDYIDYEAHWEKKFLGPLRTITDPIGWKVTTNGLLDQFYS